MNRPALHHRHP